MKKYSFYFILQCLSILYINAQVPSVYTNQYIDRQMNGDFLNLHKYWQYKEHFNAHHVVIGSGPGMSIPFSIEGDASEISYGTRTPATNCMQDVTMNAPGGPGNGLSKSKAEITENGVIYLGVYLSVLATERGLLEANNQSGINNTAIAQNNQELFFALNAYFRLEAKAVALFQAASSGGFNPNNVGFQGYFIRDDMPYNFFKAGQPGIVVNTNGVDIGCTGGQIAGVEYLNNPVDKVRMLMRGRHAFNSGDQDRDLFIGLALVTKFVPANATFQGTNLVQIARDISDRLMTNYVGQGNDFAWIAQSPDWNSPNLLQSSLNPLCNVNGATTNNNFTGISGLPRRIAVASETMFLSAFPTIKIHQLIKGSVNPSLASRATTSYTTQSPAYIPLALGIDAFAGDMIDGINDLLNPNTVNDLSCLNATPQDVWNNFFPIACMLPSSKRGTITSFLREWAGSNEGHSLVDEYTVCKNQGVWHYPIINALLHPVTGDLSVNFSHKQELETLMKEALNTAPDDCNGINWWNGGKHAPVGWRGRFRWGMQDNEINNEIGVSADYNGLDYMLAYNLFHLFYQQNMPYYNTVDNIGNNTNISYTDMFSNEYPSLAGSNALVHTEFFPAYEISDEVVSSSHLKKVIGFQKDNNVVYVHGGLVCHGTNSIRLVDGFRVEAGANFQTKIGALECDNNGMFPFTGQILREQSPESTNIVFHNAEALHNSKRMVIIFPNPTTDHLTLSNLSEMGIINKVEILNMNGQNVYEQAINEEKTEVELNVSQLPQGVYILKVDTENGQQVQKFVKE